MYLLTSTLIFISAVVYEGHAEQTLECPYISKNKDLKRVLCKRNTENQNCCTGFSFQPKKTELDGGLRVEDDGKAFTMIMNSLPQGEGVYWCGFQNGSDTIIIVAEKKLYDPMASSWTVLRWLLFVLLLLSVVSTHTCCCRKRSKE